MESVTKIGLSYPLSPREPALALFGAGARAVEGESVPLETGAAVDPKRVESCALLRIGSLTTEFSFLKTLPLEELYSKYPWRGQIVGDFKGFDGKALAHVIGDRVCLNSGFEGMQNAVVSDLFINLLQNYIALYPSAGVEKSIEIVRASQISEELSVRRKAIEYASRLRALESGETLLLFVGFINHSVIIEIVCTKKEGGDSLYDLHIYDASGEGKSHSVEDNSSELDIKMTRINFINIEQTLLLIGEEGSAWIEFLLGVDKDQTALDELDALFSVAFAHFQRDSVCDPEPRFYRVQQGGTCSWRSLIAWLHFQLEIDEYKRVVTWMQTQTLARCALNFFEQSNLSSAELRILYMSARELQFHTAMRLEKYGECEIFDQAASVARQIEDESIRFNLIISIPYETIEFGSVGVDSLAFNRVQKRIFPRAKIYIPPFLISATSLFSLSEGFSSDIRRIFEGRKGVCQESFIACLGAWVMNLKAIKDCRVEANEDLKRLLDLQTVLANSSNPVIQLSAFKMFAIIHFNAVELSREKHGDLLEKQKIQDVLTVWLNDRFLFFLSKEFLSEIEKLKLYFSPYVSEDLSECFVPLDLFNPSYIARDHGQAIVRWAFSWYDGLESLDKKKFGYEGAQVSKVVLGALLKNFNSFEFEDPIYPHILLFQSICAGLNGLLIRQKGIQKHWQIVSMGDNGSMLLHFTLKDMEPINRKEREALSSKLLTLNKKIVNFVLAHGSFNRLKFWTEEEAIVKSLEEGDLDPELQKSLVRSHAEPLELPFYLIHCFLQDIEKLADPNLRALWTLSILKIVYSKQRERFISVLVEALEEEGFKQQFHKFIEKGLAHFRERIVSGMDDFKVCEDLIRVVLIIGSTEIPDGVHTYFREAKRVDPLLKMYYLNLMGEEHSAKIIEEWLNYQSSEKTEDWFEQIARDLYYSKFDQWREKLTAADLSKITNNDYYRVDLLSGVYSTQEGVLGSCKAPEFTHHDSFKKRFPNAGLFQVTGAYFTFRVADFRFRVIFDSHDSNWEDSLAMEKQGNWNRFVPPKFLGEIIPKSLALRYLYYYDEKVQVIRGFCRKTLLETVLIYPDVAIDTTFHAEIERVEGKESFFGALLNSEYFEIAKKGGETFLRAAPLCIWGSGAFVLKWDATRRKWRHPFQEGFCLAPMSEKLCQKSEQRCELVENRGEEGPFGSIKEYISFEHLDGRNIYYLPVVSWGHKSKVSPLSQELIPQLPVYDEYSPVDQTLYLMEYRVEGRGKIAAITPEGKLYLALVYLMQKRFFLAIEEMEGFEKNELDSLICRELIESAILFLKHHHDNSWENLVGSMHLIALVFPKIAEIHRQWIESIYIPYLRNFRRIPQKFQLKPSIEEEIAIQYGLDWRVQEIRDRSASYTFKRKGVILQFKKRGIELDDLNWRAIDFRCSYTKIAGVEKFPEPISALLTGEIMIFTEKRMKLIQYALGARSQEQMDHVEFYIQVQLQQMNKIFSKHDVWNRTRSIVFLLLLKAIHYTKLHPEDPPKNYAEFLNYLDCLNEVSEFPGEPFSQERAEYFQKINDFLKEMCEDVAEKTALSISLLETKNFQISQVERLSLRLHPFLKYKPPLLSLPRIRSFEFEGSLEKLEGEICELLNYVGEDHTLSKVLKQSLGSKKRNAIQDAVYLFLRGRRKLYTFANSELTKTDVEVLMQKIQLYLVLKTGGEGKVREYDVENEPYLLVFEYGMKLDLRVDQVKLLRKFLERDKAGVYKTVAAQFQPGKGKTTVFAPILATIAANHGFGLFITPRAQTGMVCKAMNRFLLQTFNTKAFFLDFTKESTAPKKIKRLVKEFQDSVELGYPVITYPESLQLLELDYLALLETIGPESKEEEREILRSLALILSRIKEEGHKIIDEVDLVIDPLKEVNLPTGAVVSLSPEKAGITQKIFEILLTTEIGELILQNCQNEIPLNLYKTKIIQILAETLVLFFSETTLEEKPFVEFLCSEFKAPFNAQQDLFMERYENLIKRDLKKAEQIAVAKHLISDVLPIVLSKNLGKHYGRTIDKSAFKIIPYEGVDAPCETSEFGYVLELACYHFLAALQTMPTKGQIESFGSWIKSESYKSMQRLRCCLDETPEGLKFTQVTGLSIAAIQEERWVELAFEKIERERGLGNFHSSLSLEKEMMQKEIVYHTHRLSSNPHSLFGIGRSKRAFSGTPWNIETILSNLEEQYIPDEGSLEQVRDILLSRSKEVHLIDSITPENIIKALSGKIDVILDPGGTFKDKGNYEIACQIREYLRVSNPQRKEGVLFFARPMAPPEISILSHQSERLVLTQEKGKRSLPANLLAYLPLDGGQVIYLSGTDVGALEQKGISYKKSFVYIDGPHTTGTDCPFPEEFKGAIIMDETLTYPRLIQCISRFRKYLTTQDVEILFCRKTVEKIQITTPFKMEDVIDLSLNALSSEKKKIAYLSFCQRVDEVARGEVIKLLLQWTREGKLEEAADFIRGARSLISYEVIEDPIAMFASKGDTISTRELLEERFTQREDFLFKIYPAGDRKFFNKKLREILREVDSSPYLEEKRTRAAVFFGQTIEQEIYMNREMEQEIEIEYDLQRVKGFHGDSLFSQKLWDKSEVKEILEALRRGEETVFYKKFTQFFIEPFREKIPRFSEFEGVISENIYATVNFAHVMVERLPLFHEHSKFITTGLLINCGSDSYKVLLLSQLEARFWRSYLGIQPCEGVWLIDKCGEIFGNTLKEESFLEFHIQHSVVQQLLVQINALAGNISYLIEHSMETDRWLNSDPEIKLRLIRYAVLSHQKIGEQKLFESNPLFRIRDRVVIKSGETCSRTPSHPKMTTLLTSLEIRQIKTRGEMRNLLGSQLKEISPIQANLLSPNQIRYISSPQVLERIEEIELLLVLSPQQMEQLTETQIRTLCCYPHKIEQFGEQAVGILQCVAPKSARYLTNQVIIKSLQNQEAINSIDPAFFSYLTKQQRKFLVEPQLIIRLEHKEEINALEELETAYFGMKKVQKEQISEINLKRLFGNQGFLERIKESIVDGHIEILENLTHIQLISLGIDFLKSLSREAVSCLKRYQGPSLTCEEFESIPENELHVLLKRRPSLIQKDEFLSLSVEKMIRLPHEVLIQIPKDKMRAITRALNEDAIKILKAPAIIRALTPEQFQYLPQASVVFLSKKQVLSK